MGDGSVRISAMRMTMPPNHAAQVFLVRRLRRGTGRFVLIARHVDVETIFVKRSPAIF
jgi:hypothetical protein